MELFEDIELPFKAVISFDAIISDLEKKLTENPENTALEELLNKVSKVPELREGFTDERFVNKNKDLIRELLIGLFPPLLTKNEIKAVTIPLSNFIFNPTERFQDILNQTGEKFEIGNIRFESQSFYIVCSNIILRSLHPEVTSSASPLFYSITDKSGIQKHYRILYNADFLELIPNEKAVMLTEKDIIKLLNNFDNEEIWKEKFPPNSWTIKGFGIVNLYDATVEYAMSDLKHFLFNRNYLNFGLDSPRIELLKSIFNNSSVDVGISNYDPETGMIVPGRFNYFINSYLLENVGTFMRSLDCKGSLLGEYLKNDKTFIVSDVDELVSRYPNDLPALQLQKRGVKSCLMIPIIKDGKPLAIAEFVSKNRFGFNSISTHKIQILKSILTDGIENVDFELSNYTLALIQKEYTSIHPSVAWKFMREAENYLKNREPDYHFKDIVFRDVYGLYGEVDVRNSSLIRNRSIKTDLTNQLKKLIEVLDELKTVYNAEISEEIQNSLKNLLTKTEQEFEADTESEVQSFISDKIHSIFPGLNIEPDEDSYFVKYLNSLNPHTGLYYYERLNFDESIIKTNRCFSKILDKRQKEIQKVFPHYFERFSTDGTEHDMFIGASISTEIQFNPSYLYNLRLWQLQATCEMMIEHRKIKKDLPVELDVTSLILAYSTPITIRFRTDGKRFDVDGSYNLSYEIIKKRIDKAHVLNTNERITQIGKITVVYMHPNQEREYIKYFEFLREKGMIEGNIELLHVEKLQGISGLKAIRATVNTINVFTKFTYYSYSEFLNA